MSKLGSTSKTALVVASVSYLIANTASTLSLVLVVHSVSTYVTALIPFFVCILIIFIISVAGWIIYLGTRKNYQAIQDDNDVNRQKGDDIMRPWYQLEEWIGIIPLVVLTTSSCWLETIAAGPLDLKISTAIQVSSLVLYTHPCTASLTILAMKGLHPAFTAISSPTSSYHSQ
jgi:hypothetical protein